MILPAAPVRFRSGDSEYAYRPDSELFYLTGWEEPNAIAVFRGFGDDRFVLFVQPKDENAELWGGPRIGPERAVEEFGADAAYPIQEFSQRIDELLQPADRIYYRLGSHDECDAAVRRGLSTGRARRPRYGRGPHLVADPGAILDRMRLVKDQAEIARLREAASVTTAGVADGLAAIRPGVGEWEVEAALLAGFRKRGGDGASFAPIVGSGVNACTLHYVANNDVIGEQDLVLIDAGASLGYYAGDITRTVPASGSFTPEQRQLYDVVLRAQRKGLDRCGPGVTLQAIHDEVAQVLYEGLVALGVLSGDEEDLANPYYPHRT